MGAGHISSTTPRSHRTINAAERALPIVAVGRKNFLFAGHSEGAQNLALLQSIVGTCQMHGVNPYDDIRDVLVKTQVPGVSIDDRLPWNWSAGTPEHHEETLSAFPSVAKDRPLLGCVFDAA